MKEIKINNDVVYRIENENDIKNYIDKINARFNEKYNFKYIGKLDNLVSYILNKDVYKTGTALTEKNIGEILITKDKDGNLKDFLIAFDLYYILYDLNNRDFVKDIRYLFNVSSKLFDKELELEMRELKKNVYDFTPTSFLVLSSFYNNDDITMIADKKSTDGSFVAHPLQKTLENAYFNYNYVYITSKIQDKELFYELKHNSEDAYKFFTPIKGGGIDYISCTNYPKLICVYDDNRIPRAKIAVPKDYDIYALTKNLSYQKRFDGEYEEINENCETDVIKKIFTSHIYGLKSITDDNDKLLPYFISDITAESFVDVYEISFDVFYEIERSLDCFSVNEAARFFNASNEFVNLSDVIFDVEQDEANQCLFLFSYLNENSFFEPMRKTNFTEDENPTEDEKRQAFPKEINSVTDIIVSIPYRYKNVEVLKHGAKLDNNFFVNNLLTGFRFQQNIEYGKNSQINRDYNSRIERLDLGTFDIIPLEEIHYNYYHEEIKKILYYNKIKVRIILSIDKDTSCAVLHIFKFGNLVPPTKYLDLITSNNCFISFSQTQGVSTEIEFKFNGRTTYIVSLYDFLEEKFNIEKVGDPRFLLTSHQINKGGRPDEPRGLLPALLFGEAFDKDHKELGVIIDKDIQKIIDTENGSSVFDYADIYVSSSCVLQCGSNYRDYLVERIDFEIVNLFYIELLMFENSAIKIASGRISNFMNAYKIESGIKNKIKDFFTTPSNMILQEIDKILDEYAKTMDFWDTQMNYVSSRKIVSRFRTTFGTDNDLNYYKRVRTDIISLYKTKQGKSANIYSKILAFVGLLITIDKFVDIINNSALKLVMKNPIKLSAIGVYLGVVVLMVVIRFIRFFVGKRKIGKM